MPSIEDRQMYDWLASSGIDFTVILNKADKLSKSKQEKALKDLEKALFSDKKLTPFSSETKQNLEDILGIIKDTV